MTDGNTTVQTDALTTGDLLKLSPSDFADKTISQEELAALYETCGTPIKEGAVVLGKVIRILDQDVVVDIQAKSEGLIPKYEFADAAGVITVELDEEVEVFVERAEDPQGYVILSKEKAKKMKAWEAIEKAFKDENTIKGRVIDRIKGGLSVDVGVRAFLPGSLVDIRPVRHLESFKGQEFDFRVIKVNRRRGNIVLSRKALLEEKYKEVKEKTLAALEEGNLIKGIVKNITEYGAFIDLGGVDGLLHITDMSWGRISHPSEMFQIGDEVEILVLTVDKERERVQLGFKQKFPDPWVEVAGKYAINSQVQGKVVSLTDYGAFIELEPGLEGLIHVTEMSWTKKVKHPSAIFNVGDDVTAVILDINEENKRISLGYKQMQRSPWDKLLEDFKVGDKIDGKVRNVTDFGAFVEVMDGVDGLIHVSDLSWKRVTHPSEVVKKGDDIEAIITNIDVAQQKLSLSIKDLTPDVWEQFFKTHITGSIVEGTVSRLLDFGAFIDLGDGVEGLVHVSELSEDRVEKPSDLLEIGSTLKLKVVKLDPEDRKIGLSIKALMADEDVQDFASLREASGNTTMGDILGDALKKAQAAQGETDSADETSTETDAKEEDTESDSE